MAKSSSLDWFAVLIIVFSFALLAFAAANIYYYNRLRQNTIPDHGESVAMLWVNVTLLVLSIIVLALSFWVLFSRRTSASEEVITTSEELQPMAPSVPVIQTAPAVVSIPVAPTAGCVCPPCPSCSSYGVATAPKVVATTPHVPFASAVIAPQQQLTTGSYSRIGGSSTPSLSSLVNSA